MLATLRNEKRIISQNRPVLWLQWMVVVAAAYLLHFSENRRFATGRLILIAVLFAGTLLLTLSFRWLAKQRWMPLMLAAIDTLAVAAVIYFLGFARNDFYLVFVLVLILAAL